MGLRHQHFYPRPPRGGRLHWTRRTRRTLRFLSTPSARRATFDVRRPQADRLFLSTPSARRATIIPEMAYSRKIISIHALREEGDAQSVYHALLCGGFLSTPSARRATAITGKRFLHSRFLSTPSARRATMATSLRRSSARYFYPRPPRGGRRFKKIFVAAIFVFLSTPSARRATDQLTGTDAGRHYFYPRPPRGGRPERLLRQADAGYFYPRPPRGGRPAGHRYYHYTIGISIHALREEGDRT